jgi:hypothetical protein
VGRTPKQVPSWCSKPLVHPGRAGMQQSSTGSNGLPGESVLFRYSYLSRASTVQGVAGEHLYLRSPHIQTTSFFYSMVVSFFLLSHWPPAHCDMSSIKEGTTSCGFRARKKRKKNPIIYKVIMEFKFRSKYCVSCDKIFKTRSHLFE